MARFNLCPNPKLKNDDTGFFGGARVTGATDLPYATAYETSGTEIVCPKGNATTGLVYRLSAYVKGSSGATTGTAQLHWRTGGSFHSAETAVGFTVGDGQVVRVDAGAHTCPSGADGALLDLAGLDGDVQVTAILYEQTSLLGSYFDGDSTDAEWDGADGNSTSTLNSGDITSDEAGKLFGWGTPVLADEFGYSGAPDPDKWLVYGDGGDVGGDECWVGHVGNGRRCTANVTVGSGIMTITGETDGDTTGVKFLYDQQYGRWEVRMRARNVGGSGNPYHPVCLIWPSTEAWPQDGEYDFQEGDLGDTAAGAFLHYPHPPGAVQQEHATLGGISLADYHNYAFEWSADFIRGFIDGVQWFFYTGGGGPAGRRNIQTMPSGTLRLQLDNFFGAGGMREAVMEFEWARAWTIDSESSGAPQEITAVGIPSSAAFGTPILSDGGVIQPTGIESSAAFGTPTIRAITGVGFLDGRLSVQVAWGADLAADADTWTWEDVTAYVRTDPPISTRLGRADEASTSQPASCALTLNNTSGRYSLGGRSPLWPYVRRNTPVRVTIDATGAGDHQVVFFGFADGFTPGWDSLTGDIPVVKLSASGTLRRLAQGNSPVLSTYRRASIADTGVVAYWPFEEGTDAQFAANLRGGTDMTYTGEVSWGACTSFECSADLPTLKTADFNGKVNPYTDTGQTQVRFLINIPDDGLTDGTVLAYVYTTGSLLRWDLVYADAGTGNLSLYIYADDHTLFDSIENITFDMDGNDRRVSLELTQDGANLIWSLGVTDQNDGTGGYISQTILAESAGIVSALEIAPGGQCDGVGFGHLTVQDEVTSLFESIDQFRAFIGELGTTTTGRLQRLATENSVLLEVHGSSGSTFGDVDEMGFQRVQPLLPLLHECETNDQGQLWDGLDNGLSYTTRRFREDGVVALTVDASAGQLGEPFEPTDDDQRNLNRASVSRTGGVTSLYEDVTGPLGTAAIGIYDSSLSVNNANDSTAIQFAAWMVSLGTVEGYRYPSVTIDLLASPELAAAAMAVIPGARIVVTDLDATLSTFPDATVSLIVEGVAWSIGAREWSVTFTCSPFSPWGIARIAEESGDTSEFAWRLDTDGSTLAATVAAGGTSISVTTTSGPVWTTDSDDFPYVLDIGGVPITVTACSDGTSPQTMTVSALPVARTAGMPVKLHDPRPIGL